MIRFEEIDATKWVKSHKWTHKGIIIKDRDSRSSNFWAKRIGAGFLQSDVFKHLKEKLV